MALLQLDPAMRQLAVLADGLEGCRFNAKDLATELYRFLLVKRQLLRLDEQHQVDVSPGWLVDELWHQVLLESKVRVQLMGQQQLLLLPCWAACCGSNACCC